MCIKEKNPSSSPPTKDGPDKILMEKNENFAAAYNYVLTGGKYQLIKPEDLRELKNEGYLLTSEGVKVNSKDIHKEWILKTDKEGTVAYALHLNGEIQSTNDNFMPVRFFIYAATDYNHQYRNPPLQVGEDGKLKKRKSLKRNKGEKFIPVLPLLINFSLKPWRGYTSFQDCLNLTKEMKRIYGRYLPSFELLVLEPQKNADYSSLPGELACVLKLFAVVQDPYEFAKIWKAEEKLNNITPDAYNVLSARVNKKAMEKKEVINKVDVFGNYEKLLKKHDAELKERDAELKTRDAELNTRNAELNTRNAQIAAKEKEVAAEKEAFENGKIKAAKKFKARKCSFEDFADIFPDFSREKWDAIAICEEEPQYKEN